MQAKSNEPLTKHQRLRRARRLANLSQEALGEQYNISGEYLSQVETGKKPFSRKLEAILSALEAQVGIAEPILDESVLEAAPNLDRSLALHIARQARGLVSGYSLDESIVALNLIAHTIPDLLARLQRKKAEQAQGPGAAAPQDVPPIGGLPREADDAQRAHAQETGSEASASPGAPVSSSVDESAAKIVSAARSSEEKKSRKRPT